VVNVSNPANPTLATTLPLLGTLQGIYVAGNYAYVTTEVWNNFTAHDFYIVNISNPTNPMQVGSMVVFGGFPGPANGVYVVGNYAYIAGAYFISPVMGWWGGVEVVDVSNPSAPKSVRRYTTQDIAETYRIHVSGNYAFLSAYADGLLVVNVSNPFNPTEAALYQIPISTQGLAISGNYVYLADNVKGVKVVNISNPAFPSPTGLWKTTQRTGASNDIAISGQYAYVADTSGLRVLNISDPTNPVHVASLTQPGQSYGWFSQIHLSGNHAYLIDSSFRKLWIVNVANPAAPTLASSFGGDSSTFMDVYVVGNYAYVVGDGGLWVLEVSNPAQPTQAGYSATMSYLSEVAVVGSYAYVTGGGFFRVVDVSVPANPNTVRTLALPASDAGIYIFGNHAYVTACYSGLLVLDISNPANPIQVGEYNTVDCAKDARVVGNYVCIAESGNGLTIVTPTALQVAPATVTWIAKVGGANPPTRSVNVGSTGNAVA
jgi:hypothetical protein